MTITPEELQALVAHITALEAQVAEQAHYLDYLSRENTLLKHGPKELERMTSTADPGRKVLPGYGVGNAGQLIITNATLAGVMPTGSSRWRPD